MTDDVVVEQPQDDSPEPSLRDELEAAFDGAAGAEEPVSAPAQSAEEPAPAESSSDRPRDESGRFAKGPAKATDDHGAASKPLARPRVPPVGGTPPAGTPVVQPQPLPQGPKPPQSWKPLAREHWGGLNEEVRQEVLRREQEIAQALQQTAEARKAHEAFQKAVSPYEAMIRAEGSEPLRAIGSLLQTAAALRTAPPVMRAQMLAQMVRTFGVPIEALDAALSGAPLPQQQTQQQFQDPRVDQLMAQLHQYQEQQERSLNERALTEVGSFGTDKPFFGDVRGLMADIIEVAAKHKERLTLDEAYSRAVAMRPDIAKVIQQREAAKAAATAKAATQRARAAASSVKSSNPAPQAERSGGVSLRDDIAAAFEQTADR